jgi:hypothetical protein
MLRHMTELDGLPLEFHLTGNEASNGRQFETPLDIGPDVTPRAAITDTGYDAKSNRQSARRRGSVPIIPHRSMTKNRPKFFPKRLYKLRARVEQLIGKIKHFKRVAMRCEKHRKLCRCHRSRLCLPLGQIRPQGLVPHHRKRRR